MLLRQDVAWTCKTPEGPHLILAGLMETARTLKRFKENPVLPHLGGKIRMQWKNFCSPWPASPGLLKRSDAGFGSSQAIEFFTLLITS
jgi:hypothetical protein